jgi:quercetin dioxygenase-like cupin family protein
MIRNSILVLICTLVISASAFAQSLTPRPITPDSLKWSSPPGMTFLHAAWVLGSEKDSGTYVLRVKLDKGGIIPPHTHPDKRYSTVLSGTLYVGFGETFKEADLVSVPAGGVYVAPANVPHFLLAKDGDVIYQEAGEGPTATVLIKQ